MTEDALVRMLQRRLLVREANREIHKLSLRFGIEQGDLNVLCECCGGDCVERIVVPRAVVEQVLRAERLFVVRDDHVDGELERPLERRDWALVELHDHVRRAAESIGRRLWSREPETRCGS